MANCPMSSLPMKNMMSSSPMENLTVTQATYKPHTVHLRKKPPVTLEKRHAGPWTVVTTHRDTYRIEKEAFATITKPPKDHWFLAGDGLSRFGSTVYGTDYSKRPGQPGNYKSIIIPLHRNSNIRKDVVKTIHLSSSTTCCNFVFYIRRHPAQSGN